ncbi:hypothetical protein AGMMS49921_12580 [Endomicrobiia bacterium]|nr:hypothetical protein AGMMS49921_12580 [Endomicrobiia bacterium]
MGVVELLVWWAVVADSDKGLVWLDSSDGWMWLDTNHGHEWRGKVADTTSGRERLTEGRG